MGVMASQITGASIICWTICSGADQKKTSERRVNGLCAGIPRGDRWILLTKGQ